MLVTVYLKNLLYIAGKMLRHLFNLGDPRLEDQLIDRCSFQHFVGISLDQDMPDIPTFRQFMEALRRQNLDQFIFDEVTDRLDRYGLIVKKGTLVVDGAIMNPSFRPLLNDKRKEHRWAHEPKYNRKNVSSWRYSCNVNAKATYVKAGTGLEFRVGKRPRLLKTSQRTVHWLIKTFYG